ncbi:MAG: UDP-3-O-acyl-N-acetylglucosamine deacetylase [Alphaproteobacteria bacterium]|nr:UDP-3-O-acyl-N-acetylglucosamine deacetylase [Alphaproteobacteria bacterium]
MKSVTKKIKISGVGIHSGLPVNMVVKPSKKYGIFFKRSDIKNSDLIPATYDNVGETLMRNTTIGKTSGAHVQTIEHLMAALFLSGIDSAVIEIDDKETPILDGSAYEFYKAFEKNVSGKSNMKKIIVKKTVVAHRNELVKQMPFFKRIKTIILNHTLFRKGNGYVKLSPNNGGLKIDATLVYPDKIIGSQSYSCFLDGSKKSINDFIKNISKSRTFGKYSEWEYLKAHGMGRGANENNVIALNAAGDGTLNKLYYPDEFVRHKIIDAVGDMFTSSGFIYGHLESVKGSHALNNLVLRKLFSDKSNYEIIEEKGK